MRCNSGEKGEIIMRIAVVGIGGVGGYIGAKLCAMKADHEVIFIARGEHAGAVKKNGLKIIEDDGTFTTSPAAVYEAKAAKGTFDLILLCVKSYDIAPVVEELKKNITTETIIIPFANGVGHADTLAETLHAKVLNGCAYILSHIIEPGVIRKKGKVFAAVFGHREYPEETRLIAKLFEDAGLRCKTPEDIEEAVWKKYLFICAFATLTSYYDAGIKPVYDAHRAIAEAVLGEIAAVATSKGIDLSDETTKALETASNLPSDASTSMHLDFQHHRKTELETLTGYIVNEAKVLGIPAPTMTNMYNVLKEKSNAE